MKKIIFKSIIISFTFFGIGFFIIKGFAALSSVTSGTPLTASTWNNMISNFYWGSGSNGIYYNGNVGIGTINPVSGNGSIGRILEIGSNLNSTFVASTNGATNAGIFEARATSGVTLGDTRIGQIAFIRTNDITPGKVSGVMRIRINNDGTITNALNISSLGNVGIGTYSPSYTLHVNGTAAIGNARATSTDGTIDLSGLKIYRRDGRGTQGIFFNSNVGDTANQYWENMLIYNQGGGSNITFLNGGTPTEKMRITPSGKVGIGTNSPSYTLHINGTVAGTSWTATSDLRFKKNISTITGALDKINNLRGVNFDWRVGEFSGRNFQSGHKIGFIAQEVEKILPQVVNTDNQGFKSVEYSNLTAILVEAIKQQQNEINQLKNELKLIKKETE